MRPASLTPQRQLLWEELHVDPGPITLEEVSNQGLTSTEVWKASREDSVQPEFWKGVFEDRSAICWVLEFCSTCLNCLAMPESWRKSREPALCENYCPISLLSIGYKVFAAVLHGRLVGAGAEVRIWTTQFGFHSKAGALFAAIRLADLARTWPAGSSRPGWGQG